MTERINTTTAQVADFLAEKYASTAIAVHPVDGGYSRNRRAIIEVNGKSMFAKEVDTSILPGDGQEELGWLRKEHAMVNELVKYGVNIVPEWAELHLNGHLLLTPSYKKEDGWQWTLPNDESVRADYIQAVVNATKQLEETVLPESLTEPLSLQPYFRDKIAEYDGLAQLFHDDELRTHLIDKYTMLQRKDSALLPMILQMIETLSDDARLKELQEQTNHLAQLPNDCLNHCDVRSDNLTFNIHTGEIKLVDWNWASYAPAKFGATEFLLDMARRGVDVSPWYQDVSIEFLAGSVGYFMIRSLKPPLTPGSTLRDVQAETAAAANYLYTHVKQVSSSLSSHQNKP